MDLRRLVAGWYATRWMATALKRKRPCAHTATGARLMPGASTWGSNMLPKAKHHRLHWGFLRSDEVLTRDTLTNGGPRQQSERFSNWLQIAKENAVESRHFVSLCAADYEIGMVASAANKQLSKANLSLKTLETRARSSLLAEKGMLFQRILAGWHYRCVYK